MRKYRDLVRNVLPLLLAEHVKVKRSATIWDIVMTTKTVLLTWGDSVSDLIALALLLEEGSRYATPMLVALIVANFTQALCTYLIQRESAMATVAALFSLKPLVDGFNIICGTSYAGNVAFDPEENFGVSRIVETAAESVGSRAGMELVVKMRLLPDSGAATDLASTCAR